MMAATVDRLAPESSRYRKSANVVLERNGVSNTYNVPLLSGILQALKADYEAGYLQSLEELVHADVFADFLEMARYLLSEGYKDPAAVLIGGVLEEHLRKLCCKNGIPIEANNKPRKADALNSDLTSKNSISKLDQKNVTAWLDLRNKAAHGRYGEYSREQVELLHQSVLDFLTRVPA
jgi:hypothetical protein